ncbi:MAG: S8 family serine peptidase [Bacteroidales bacterium]|nr:S8 family serine peptidase [Bacteroidales bacterium]
MKKTLLFLALFVWTFVVSAQDLYWVFFTDKNGTDFDPYAYFDAKAIQRRTQQQLPLFDSTDFPLNRSYVTAVERLSDELVGESRWFNAAAVSTSRIDEIRRLPFVAAVTPIATRAVPASVSRDADFPAVPANTALLYSQLRRMQGEQFVDNGIDGTGIRIAVLDGGFKMVDEHPAFQHLRDGHRILKTYNFPLKRENVYGWSSHGTMVLSCIAGIKNGDKIGLATGAEFLLARTEVDLEPRKEEVWWLMGMEWADRNGANIINSSLGYGKERYNPEDMDGTSMVARAANMAATKGILVCNSMGNEGDDRTWRTLITPADADSVLSVGGIDEQGNPSDFTSWGPTADGRLKPNVCAYGHAFVANPSKSNPYTYAYGTSFSSPLVAGFAACAWQARPQLNNMELKTEIEKSADRYPTHDFRYGYGVPQASYFVGEQKKAAVGELGAISGKVTNQRGEALAFIYVYLQRNDSVINYVMTDLDGEYALHDVQAGTYYLTFDALYACGVKETETNIVLGEGEDFVVNHEIKCSPFTDRVVGQPTSINNPVPRKRGVNARYNFAPYLSWGFVAPAGPTKPINYGKSESFLVGLRFKGNICKWYSMGVAAEIGATWYNLKEIRSDFPKWQNSDSLRYVNLRKENVRVSFLQAEFYQRFRLVPGGLFGYGLFFDTGIYGGWNFYCRHKTVTDSPYSDSGYAYIDDNDPYRIRTSTRATYMAAFQWGVRARLGFDIVAVYVQYRISRLDRMPSDMEYPYFQGWAHDDFPALEVGLQLTVPLGK